MKQRVISIEVLKGDVIVYQKDVATPQHLMAVLTLFEDDGVVVTCRLKDIDIPSSSSAKN